MAAKQLMGVNKAFRPFELLVLHVYVHFLLKIMPFCYCPGCAHDSRRETCSFYRFPADHKQFYRWKKMCRRADRDPTREDRLCSCHFSDGNKMLGPTIFPWNKEGVWNFPFPEKRIRKKKDQTEELSIKPTEVMEAGPSSATPPEKRRRKTQVPSEENLELPFKPTEMEAGPSTATPPLQSPAMEKAELYFLEKENKELKELVKKGEKRLSFQDISGEDKLVFQYTGLPTSTHFLMLHSLLQRFTLAYYSGWNVEAISPQDQLLCTLMKLRLNLQMFDLAFRFKLSNTTIQNIILTYIYALHEILYQGMMNIIPSRNKNLLFVPTCFRDFPNCKIVLDCTEIEIAIPQSLKLKKALFSHYKQRHTFKVLVGVAPNGTITFVSELFPGSTSDKEITKQSGVLHHMEAGDLILADKGFLIKDMCNQFGITVNIPPFLTNPQFTIQEALFTRKIARARIHVERAINRLKNFRVLDFIMPYMREHSTVIVQTCAALVNFQYALLKESEQCLGLHSD